MRGCRAVWRESKTSGANLLYIPVSFFTIRSHISCLLAHASSGRGATPLVFSSRGSDMKDLNLREKRG